MKQRRKRVRKDGGLLPLVALSAALLIGGLGAAIPKPAIEAARSNPAGVAAHTDPIHASLGPVSRARSPATLPPDAPDAAHRRHGGGRE